MCYFNVSSLKNKKIFNRVYSSRPARNIIQTSRYFRTREIHDGSHNSMKEPESQEESKIDRRDTDKAASYWREKGRDWRVRKKNESKERSHRRRLQPYDFHEEKPRKFFQCRITTFLSAILFVLTTSMLNRMLHWSGNNARIFVAEYDVNMKIVVVRYNRERKKEYHMWYSVECLCEPSIFLSSIRP